MKRSITTLLIALIVMLVAAFGASLDSAYAASSLPRGRTGNNDPNWLIGGAQLLKLDRAHLTGVQKGSGVSEFTNDSGDRVFLATADPEGSITNPATFTFENCGNVMGGKTKVVMQVTKISYGKRYKTSGAFASSKSAFVRISASNTSIGCNRVNSNGTPACGDHVYGGNMYVTCKVTVYPEILDANGNGTGRYSGTPLRYPFAALFKDLDQKNELASNKFATESVTLNGSEWSEYWTWNAYDMAESGYTFSTPRDRDLSYPESITKGGFMAVSKTASDSFSFTSQCGCNMANAITVYKVVNSGKFQIRKSTTNPEDTTAEYNFAGIEYTLYNSANQAVGRPITLRANGQSDLIEVPAGTYTLKETKTNGWYKLNSRAYTVTITRNKTDTIVYTSDEPKLGSVEIKKVVQPTPGSILPAGNDYLTDKDNNKEHPLKFKLSSSSGKTYPVTLGHSYNVKTKETTELQGSPLSIVYANIPYGTYTLTEDRDSLHAAEERVNDTTGHFDEAQSFKNLTVIIGDTTVIKDGNKVVNSYTNYWETDPDYRLKISKVVLGGDKYDGWKFEVYDNPACSGEPLGYMSDEDGNEQPDGTDNEGTVYITGLPGPGIYYVKETTVRKPYSAAVNPVEVAVAKTAANTVVANKNNVAISTTSVPFVNNRNYIDIRVAKNIIKNNGRPDWNVGGIEFTLYDSHHNKIVSEVTKPNGELVFSGIDNKITDGEYVIEETGFDEERWLPSYCVPGYDKPSRRVTLEGDEAKFYSTDPETGTCFTNIQKPEPGAFSISIQKTSTDSNTMLLEDDYSFEGITYGVYADEECTDELTEITLNATGAGFTQFRTDAAVESMEVWVKEKSTGGNYKLSSEVIEGTVAAGEVLEISVADEPETASLSFTKEILCDDPDATVPGPEKLSFDLINTDNPSISFTERVSGSTVRFSDVPIGNYILIENSLTDYKGGYMLDNTGPVELTLQKGSNTIGTSGNKWTNYWVPEEKPGGIDILKKTNNGYITDYSEFHITITDVSSGKKLADNEALNANGTFSLGDLAPGTYRVHENLTENQLKLYEQPADQDVVITENTTQHAKVTFNNVLKTTTIKVIKNASDGNVGGIEFRLYGTAADGQQIGGALAITEKKTEGGETFGEAVFTNVKAGSYVIAETGFDSEYYTSNHRVEGYDVPAKNVSCDGETAQTVTFINNPMNFQLVKKEKLPDGTATNDPVPYATYTLYRLDPDNPPQTEADLYTCYSKEFTTDANGVINTGEVTRGTWMVFESITPEGYIEDYSVPSDYPIPEVTESNLGHYIGKFTLDDEHSSVSLSDYNTRLPGSVYLTKIDDAENPVEGASFALYTDSACRNIAVNLDGQEMRATSDIYGSINDPETGRSRFSNLAWGTYYLKETKAPRGYKLDNTVHTCEISQHNLDINVRTEGYSGLVNERGKGKVRLVKRDADNQETLLNGAHFDLYTSAGELVKEGLVTGQDNNGDEAADGTGVIQVDGLTWGAYYFKETQAPDNYVLNPELTRFTVNAFSISDEPQTIYADNEKERASITITVKIKASDYWAEHGNPTFFAVVKDQADANVEYKRPLTFDEEYVKNHTDGNGYVSKSVTLNIPAGSYNAFTEKADRYELDTGYPSGAINSVQLGTLGSNNDVDFTIGASQQGTATFVYKKTDWSSYSDQTARTNLIKKQRVFTGLSVEYLGDAEKVPGNMPFSKALLSVHALFDDGSAEELSDVEYSVTDPNNGDAELTRFPTVSGWYTYTVSATIKGTTRYGTFTVFVKDWQKVKVFFHPNGGGSIPGKTGTGACTIDENDAEYIEVWQYQPLTLAEPNPQRYTPAAITGYDFAGWFTDSELTQAFDASADIAENMHAFAKWTIQTYRINYLGAAPDSSVTVSNVPAQQTKTWNEPITLSSQEPTINKGYDFLGWSLAQGGHAQDDVDYAPGATYTENSALDLYAVWKPHTATLTYNASANGGSLGSVPATTTMSYNAAEYAYSAAQPTKTDYSFYEWNTKADGTGTSYAPGAEYKAAYVEPENSTLYAIFKDMTAPAAGNIAMNTGNVVSLTATDAIGVTAYYFGTDSTPSSGAFTSVTSTTSLSATADVSEAGTYYFFAKDEAGNVSAAKTANIQPFRIVFYENGVELAPEDNAVGIADFSINGGTETDEGVPGYDKLWLVGTAYSVIDPRVVPGTEEDCVYDGLQSGSSALNGTLGTNGATVKLKINSKAMLSYEENITDDWAEELEINHMPSDTPMKYARAASVNSTAPSRTGFSFNGWNTAADGSGTAYAPGDEIFGANTAKTTVVLYAQWEKCDLGSDDLTWEDVETIGDLGIAPDFFAEDFSAVKNALDVHSGTLDSQILAEHTKTFTIGNSTYHAFIAGFDHDELASGGTAAITFLSYESVGSYKMHAEDSGSTWATADLRTTDLPGLLSTTGEDLQDVLKQVKKTTADYATGNIIETSDVFFVPSVEELVGQYVYETKP